MSEECTHDCSSCSSSCEQRDSAESGFEKETKVSIDGKRDIGKIYAVVSGKGGVGKSLVTALTAVGLKRMGKSVAVLDADVTGPSIPKLFGISEPALGDESGLYPVRTKGGIDVMSINLLLEDAASPVVWRGPVIGNVVRQFYADVAWGRQDIMLLDMPPGTGDVPLTVFQLLQIDGIIIVTSPQELVSMIVEKALTMANMMKIPVLGLVENMSYFECECGRRHEILGASHAAEVAEKYELPLLARLPIDARFAALCDAGDIESVGEFGDLSSVCKLLAAD